MLGMVNIILTVSIFHVLEDICASQWFCVQIRIWSSVSKATFAAYISGNYKVTVYVCSL